MVRENPLNNIEVVAVEIGIGKSPLLTREEKK
jgi:hypothetical protein